MKKYKLIKEYPGSPKLGFINGEGSFTYGVHIVEKYPEYWEEIIEKNYEILSFYNKEGKSYYNIITQGYYYSEPASSRSLAYCLLYYKIHSVKRLSDGEIFTSGDNTNAGIIKEFSICGNTLQLKVDGLIFLDNYLIKKTKQPLFTTEDGVDIYDLKKSDFWYLKKQSFDLYHKIINENGIFLYEPQKELYFSSKEKAEEYILMNKKSLSPNDILKVWSKLSGHSVESLLKNSKLMHRIITSIK